MSIWRFFSRSTSAAGKVGRWMTSAKIANAGPRLRVSTSKPIAVCSRCTPPSSVTPRSPSALSIASAERVFVPMSIVRTTIAAVPGWPAGSAIAPARVVKLTATLGSSARSTT